MLQNRFLLVLKIWQNLHRHWQKGQQTRQVPWKN